MKNLLLLLALMCIITTSCEESGIEGPNNPIEQPGDENGNIDTPIECGDNEILYTTKYGYPIELNITDGFGGNLMSNTYENGYGRIIFDDDVIYIPKRAFRGCTAITTIILPNSLSAIGESAFYDCVSLTSITIPDGVTSIGDNAFDGCDSLTSITIPDSVTSIGNAAVQYCISLASVTIPNSVTTIGYDAFRGCTSLKAVYCKATTPPTGSSRMFYGNASGRLIYVPAESVDIYKTTSYWDDYKDYIIASSDF